MDPALDELLSEGSPDDEVAVVIKLTSIGSTPPGTRIVTRFGPVATCRLQRGDIPRVWADPGVHSMKAPRLYRPEPVVSTDAIDDDAEAADLAPRDTDDRRPEQLTETGRGVLVAHIDWGADIAHPDFRHAGGRTRFAAIWDQGADYDIRHPNPYGYGRIYSASEIDHALQSDDPYGALGYHPARGTPAGGSHGCHTLGISAGNGRSGGPSGLAPEATLVFVDLSTQRQPSTSGLGDSAALLEGLAFIADVAAMLGESGSPWPFVVNASLGRQAGQHDGETLTEQGMDAFLQLAPGRAIVQSTGNYFGRHIHTSGLLRPGGEAVLEFVVADPHTAHELDLWYPGSDLLAVHVCGPAGMAPVLAIAGQTTVLRHDGRPVGRVYHRRFDPNNGDHELALYLDESAPPGCWALKLLADDVVDGRFHGWFERGAGRGTAQAAFVADDDSPCCTLGTICNGLRTLAVGAVDGHSRGRPLARFSSGGPTRDGRSKPDLVAPGQAVLSARSASADGIAKPLLMRMSGTSMAAPHVTGCVALMFAAAQRPLAISETRRLLLATTQPAAPAADAVASWRLGAGHLDTLAAVEAARRVGAAAARPDTYIRASLKEASLTRSDAMPTNTPPEFGLPAATSGSPASAEAAPAHQCECASRVPAEGEADASSAEADNRSSQRRRSSDLPLQFQIPIGGGAPSLALPIGGARSPFAFSVPLGGAPSPTPPLAAQPAAAAGPPPSAAPLPAAPAAAPLPEPAPIPMSGPAAAAEPPVPPLAAVPATAFEAPVIVAGNVTFDAPVESGETETGEGVGGEYYEPAPAPPSPGLELLAAAEAISSAGGDHVPRSTSQWLRQLLGTEDLDGIAVPSATTLFNAFAYGNVDPTRQTTQARYRRSFVPVAVAGDHVEGLRVQPGDLLLRVALGQDYAHLAVVASPVLCTHEELPTLAWRVAGQGQPRPGYYLHVVEVLPRARRLSDKWARRIADGRGRVLPGTLLLRRHESMQDRFPDAESYLDALAEDSGTDVRWLQNALNEVLGTHLAVDGDAGPATRSAVRSFQSSHGLTADGVAGPRTLAALREALASRGGAPARPTPTQPGGGSASRTAVGECETLSGFPQGRDTLSATHHTQLAALAKRILRDGSRAVLVTGFASSEGGDIDNFVLGMRRASRVSGELRTLLEGLRPGSTSGIAIVPFSRGESEQIAGGDRVLNRRVTVCLQARAPAPQPVPPGPATSTRVFRVVAKSFIGRIGSRVGTLDCHLDSRVSTAARVISPLGGWLLDRLAPGASNVGLDALAWATDQAFSENPADDRIFTAPPPAGKGYRLFSRGQLNAQSRGTELTTLALMGAIETDAGKECLPRTSVCLQAPPLVIDQPFVTRRIDPSRIAFRWGVKGRPPPGAEIGLEISCMRDSVFIWHQVDGVVDCSSGTAQVTGLTLTGSRFPSHRLWVDGTLERDIVQGPLSALWDGAPGDSTRVR